MFDTTHSSGHRFGIAGGFDVPGTVVPGMAGDGGAVVGADGAPGAAPSTPLAGGVVGAPGPVPGMQSG